MVRYLTQIDTVTALLAQGTLQSDLSPKKIVAMLYDLGYLQDEGPVHDANDGEWTESDGGFNTSIYCKSSIGELSTNENLNILETSAMQDGQGVGDGQ